MPSSSPTYDFRIFPVINERYRSVNATYFCHRRHLHSTPNPYRRMFDGLSLDSLVFIKQMVVTLIPFDATYDLIGIKTTSKRLGSFDITTLGVQEIALEGQVAGRLTLNNPGIIASRASDWNYILNQVVYRLDLDRMPPSACDTFVGGGYHREIRLSVVDRYGRVSNTVSRNINFQTATFVFTNEKPVKINNAQPYVSVIVSRNVEPAYRGNPNVNFTVVNPMT